MDELMLLRALEEKVRRMFDFTGWSDGVDDDAAQAIINVDAVLRDLTNWKLLQSRYAGQQEANRLLLLASEELLHCDASSRPTGSCGDLGMEIKKFLAYGHSATVSQEKA